MNLVETFVNTNLIHSLGWTLIHSIWQIILIGLTLRILLFLFISQSANVKYTISVSAYTLILIVSLITFISYFNSGTSFHHSESYSLSSQLSGGLASQSEQSNFSIATKQSLFPLIRSYISSNIHFIVVLWLTGLIIFYFRIAGTYWYVQRLKTRNLYPLNNNWNIKVNDLKNKLKIHKIIRFAESTAIQIPIVIGHLKPIILLPIGMISSLPYNQVEAIILHELAHIKRNDYLVNLIKSLVEIIFFYHPLAWWISSKIDDEREHCCDDMTIRIATKESSLQEALLNLQELKINTKNIPSGKPTYIAAALFKNKHQLLKRIKRMKTQQNTKGNLRYDKQKKFNGLAGILLLLISVAIIATFSAFSPSSSDLPETYQNLDISSTGSPLTIEEPLNENIQIPQSDQQKTIIISVPDSTKKAKKELDRDNDQDIDSDKDRDKDIDKDKELQKELERAELELEKAEIEIDKAMKVYDRAMIDYHKTLSKTNNSNDIEAWPITEKDYAKALALAELQLEQIEFAIPDMEELRITEILEDQLEVLEKLSLDEHLEISENLIEEAIKLNELEEELLSAEMIEKFELIEDKLNLQMAELEEVLENQIEELEDVQKLEFEAQLLETKIKSELLKDKLIKNEKDDLSFKLSLKKLEINGIVQSSTLHKKYLNLYEELTGEIIEGTSQLIFQD